MRYKTIAGKYSVSCVGVGGHYSVFDGGKYDVNRTGKLDMTEVAVRRGYIERALEAGINYFDTTSRNEAQMLSDCITPGMREKMFINGMVLMMFRAAEQSGADICAYFNDGLDARLRMFGGHLDSVMICAVNEFFDESQCEKLVRLMEKRRDAGDVKLIGFSCHVPDFARRLADQYPQFGLIMLPYNFHNRARDDAFEGYRGSASFIAMKPLVWEIYGIPITAVNKLPDPKALLGIAPVGDIAAHALSFAAQNPAISSVVCGINGESELEQLIKAGDMTPDTALLAAYEKAMLTDKNLPFLTAAFNIDKANERVRFYARRHLAEKFGIAFPFDMFEHDPSYYPAEKFEAFEKLVLAEARERGLDKYLAG